MKAAVLRELKKPMVVEEVERPTPGEGEVLIKVEACGVCHSDLHIIEGDWRQFGGITKIPLIPGHEVAGRVAEVGGGVRDLKVGDRVGVPWIYWTCGKCEFCQEGYENLCSRQKITGCTVDGGYAEFIKAPATHATRIPDAVSSIQAAPLFCAGVTVYRALKQAEIVPGQRVGIFGVGGLGHLAIQVAKYMGADVFAIDVSKEKLELASMIGVTRTLNATTPGMVKELRLAGGLHVALVTSGTKMAYDLAFPSVRGTGKLLVVGLPSEISFPPIMMAATEIRVQASAVGTRDDLRKVLDLAASGILRCKTSTRPLSEVGAVLDEMRGGKISGRIVLTM
ncbi:MAG TPA: alcohol dehydrogenase catalytic domain-containing protein [Candidatus Angelobacter sp.]|jgi:propanol-preferring alcohol dehydrogenase|nr:alcohol dehydrogenase catalytic domain-containing protein [Candidatus Angelobacter sp.]